MPAAPRRHVAERRLRRHRQEGVDARGRLGKREAGKENGAFAQPQRRTRRFEPGEEIACHRSFSR
jgi:hypothetical protein